MRASRLAAIGLLGWLGAADLAVADEYRASDPSAPPVARENLLASERFWPYQVTLTAPWRPEGRIEPLSTGTGAVLVRIEGSGDARVDFGRDGRALVPVDKTDIVERANEIRTGARDKTIPNLIHALGPRLVDAEAETIRALDVETLFDARLFLAVFADPSHDGFEAMASTLRPMRSRSGVTTLLLPQGAHPDTALRGRLRDLEWPVSFLRDEYGEGYARALRSDAGQLPAVMLLTPEGRVLFDEIFGDDVAAKLASAIDLEETSTRPAQAASARPQGRGVGLQ